MSLTTIHGAKGQEFETVYLIGMAEEILPSWHSLKKGNGSAALEEERRGCFVAVTRVPESASSCRGLGTTGDGRRRLRGFSRRWVVWATTGTGRWRGNNGTIRAARRRADAGLVSHHVHGGPTRRAEMKNVTITLPDDLARWLRVRAAEDDRSVSRWIADLLAGVRRGEDEYEVAMREFLAVKPRRMEWVDGRRPTRKELHDRRRFSLTPNSQRTPATR